MTTPKQIHLSARERKTQITRLLRIRKRSAEDLAAVTGMAATTVRRYLADLRGKRAHIADWAPAKGGCADVPLWSAGSGEDAPRPGRSGAPYRDPDTYSKRRRAIKRADGLARELRKLPADNPLQALVSATLHVNH